MTEQADTRAPLPPPPTPTPVASQRRRRLPAIGSRLAFALTVWALAWGAAVAIAVWLAAGTELDELLDDTLRASTELLAGLTVTQSAPAATDGTAVVPGAAEATAGRGNGTRFAWQVVGSDGRLQMRSRSAPAEPWFPTSTPGFGHARDWRVYGLPLGTDGRILYAAQSREERLEVRAEVVASAIVAALPVGVLGLLWLLMRVRAETSTLQNLSDRLATHDALSERATLGPAERRELQPVHDAIDQLARNLARRIDTERAFAGHAAHALRTPLAGIDAQLAVALRECPESLRPRLQRAREAGIRLQRVVSALLALFRSGEEPQLQEVDVTALLARLPVEGVQVHVSPNARITADPDLLAAALLDLFDNARRHGGPNVTIDVPVPQTLRLRDDGPGVDAARRSTLQSAISAQAYDGATGLGLMLADRVARAHGGGLSLPATPAGFAVELRLGPVPAPGETNRA